MDLGILLAPPIAFLACLGFALVIYGVGALIGVKPKPTPGKLEPYACGEDFTAEKFRFGYRAFFVAAIFFTIMHVAVLTIATVPGGALAYRAFGYLIVIAASISILYSNVD
jgi:NADH:ubiquinone oxidoreductase subunit 3 (subunit A)